MNPALIAPVVLALGALGTAWVLPRFVHPAICVKVLVGGVGVSAVAILAALLQIVLSSLGEVPTVHRALAWCPIVYGDDHGGSVLAGLAASSVLVVGVIRVVRRRRSYKAELRPWSGTRGVQVLDASQPVAFAVPGDPGSIVLSSALLKELDADEQRAVLAHERAHLGDRHHRLLSFVECCAVAFPILEPMARRIRFATERWADERAAAEVGSRTVVARAVARVGLLTYGGPATALGFGSGSAPARVDALLAPAPDRHAVAPLAASAAAGLGVLLGSSIQVHHLVALIAHLCGW